MASVFVSEIIDRAKAAADMEEDDEGFVSPTQWLGFINAEYRQLYTRVARGGYPLFSTDEAIVTNGSAQYDIDEPAAVIYVKGIRTDGTFYRVPIKSVLEEKAQGNAVVGIPRECYILRNTGGEISIRFFPNPSSGNFLVGIIPAPDTLDASSSIEVFPIGWEERIVQGAARRAVGKEATISTVISETIRETDNFIDNGVFSYLLRESPCVSDVDEISTSPNTFNYSEWMFF